MEDEKVENEEIREQEVQETKEIEEVNEEQAEVKEENEFELKLKEAEEKIEKQGNEIQNKISHIEQIQQQKINLEKEVAHVS
jgi:hypothetical protein